MAMKRYFIIAMALALSGCFRPLTAEEVMEEKAKCDSIKGTLLFSVYRDQTVKDTACEVNGIRYMRGYY